MGIVEPPTPIQACLNRWKTGDPSARADLLHVSRERLLVMVRSLLNRYRILRRWEESDDILQNVLIRLDRALQQIPLDTTRDFLAIAATNVRRELMDLMRHYLGPEGAGRHMVSPAPDWPHRDWPEPTPSDDPAVLQRWTEFHDQISGLPPDEHEVFLLRWYMGLTLQEVADTLNVSLRTVTRRWVAAKLYLADVLDSDMLSD